MCGTLLPPAMRPEFCPVCTLQGALAPESGPPPSLHQVGDYELVEELARGGAGVVFRARQVSLGRQVAVKLLLAGQFANAATRQRFQTEAAAAASLRHPNIVTIHEVGEHEGQPWLAMELMEGGTLADRVRPGPMPPREAAAMVAKLAQAVQIAHGAGILHRDLKPSNILLDSFGEPRITDFGLAKLLAEDSQLTLSGQVLGSPCFMAPEQAVGDSTAIDARTDVYSLGAILYQLLTARPPFQSDCTAATLRQVEQIEPVSVTQLNPSVPVDLETVTLKCLEKTPARRYSSAHELAEELERFLGGRPVIARPLGPLQRGWRWARRRKGLAATWLLLLLLAVGSTIAAVFIQRAEQRAVARLAEALVAQSAAVRHGGRIDRRAESLRLLNEAHALNTDAVTRQSLRNEAIAALALPEYRVELPDHLPPSGDAMMLSMDPEFQFATVMASDDRLRVIALVDGRELKKLSIRSRTADQVMDLSRGGRHLILRRGGRVLLWDVESDREALSVDDATGFGVFNEEGTVFLRGEAGGLAGYSLPNLERTFTAIAGLPAEIKVIAQIENERSVLALANGEVALFDPTENRLLWRQPAGNVSSLATSPDGRRIGAGLSSGRIHTLDVATGEITATYGGFGEYVISLCFDPTGGQLVAADIPGNLRVYGLPDGELLLKQQLLTWQLRFSPYGDRLGPVRRGDRVGWLTWTPSAVLRTLRPARIAAEPRFARFSPDGRWLARAAASEVLIWNVEDGRLLAQLPARRVTGLDFGAGADELFVSEDGGFRRWRLEEDAGRLVASRLPHRHEAELFDEFAFTGDRSVWIGTTMSGDRIRIGRRETADEVREIGQRRMHHMLALSPDGELALTGRYDQPAVRVFRVADGREVFTLEDSGAICGAFSADGRWLATAGKRTQLWRVSDWQLMTKLEAAPAVWPDQVPAFSPQDNTLAYCASDRIIRLVIVPDGRPLADLELPGESGAHGLAFDQQGRHLAVTRDHGVTAVWDLQALRGELSSRKLGGTDSFD